MFYRDNAALLYLFSHVSSCFHDRTSDNPHMLHSNKTSQFLPLASLPWQPDSFLEPTFLLAYIPQSRGRRPKSSASNNPKLSAKLSALSVQKTPSIRYSLKESSASAGVFWGLEMTSSIL